MIPSALAAQLRQGLGDFLRFSFWSSTPGMEQVVEDLLAEPGALLKGPYVSLKLPFVRGTQPGFFPAVPLGFLPHLHQEQAFARLGGRRKLSTLVATGTGSGKTESFLLPILDHCLADAGEPGVKAILIYPMNALANDQAARIARWIHGNDRLRGRVTAGLYIGTDQGGDTGGETRMGPASVITDRATLQEAAPNVLLTNYKMLDYLLLRPEDQKIWQHNGRGTLRFLVVDEIHTFDGAQGTDLACLLRRLKRRLLVDDGSLCCVGTSATLGGAGAGDALRRYAEAVFGERFDAGSVIGESRVDEATFLAGAELRWTAEPGPDDEVALDPAAATDPGAWLQAQVRLWLGEEEAAGLFAESGEIGAETPEATREAAGWQVALGDRLRGHAAFHQLLYTLAGRTLELERLVADLARQRSAWREDPHLGRLALGSLLALVSAARSRREELPEARRERQERGQPPPREPFLDVRLELWQRELRRMVATVGPRPRLRHSMDLDQETRRKHLPLVHCRECGALGWAALVERDKQHLLRTDLDRFYPAYFANDPRVRFLYPAAAIPPGEPAWHQLTFRLDTETLTRLEPDEGPQGEAFEVVAPPVTRSRSSRQELSRDCPFCVSRDSLSLLGYRAATLTSVDIDQLFASPFNEDKKLLTFSDSVQDAAHRAGFFGARTWRTNLRIAMLRVIRERPGLTLAELADALGPFWAERLDVPTWVATFLAPNMAWLHDWGTLKTTGELPRGSDLPALIRRRLAFEACSEFGLQAGIGRSLPRTGAATVSLDPERLTQALAALMEPLRNEVPGLREVRSQAVRCFVLGLLHHLRLRGGILARGLPGPYVESRGQDVNAFQRNLALPAFGPTSRLPALLTDRPGSRFETWGRAGKQASSWYRRWADRCFGADRALTADAASLYAVALPILVASRLLKQETGKEGAPIWGLAEEALRVTPAVRAVCCTTCGHRTQVAEAELAAWQDLPCLTARCPGAYRPDPAGTENYFGRLYAGGDLQRIFTEEHTGLLGRGERERVEREFKAPAAHPDDPAARRPWFANLLSSTPTLEMGIDIGDLSAAILCSVPPSQASYLQRIGRAGRRDGNAFLLTVAGGRPHDLYFFAEPAEMIRGEVTPPGVFLDAPAVLERQLTAFCFDRWVAIAGSEAELPRQLRAVFSHLEDAGSQHFPFNLLRFIEERQPVLLREFGEMFAGAVSEETRAHLGRFMEGTEDGRAGLRWKLLDALRRERNQRDSLAARARSLREQIKKQEESPARALDHDEQLARLATEKEALLQLVKSINQRRTLEFFTDEGLLPNYAFPESAVRLRSVIWRKKKVASEAGRRYDTWSYEYQRSPSSALSELAPGADFHASGRRVVIDQVDVAVSEVETWRFCTECNHAERIDLGDEAAACPACHNAGWRDSGQLFRLLKLQQVFANAPDRESRIKDDRDDRQPRFFERQMLVEIDASTTSRAWRIDDDSLPFGFEYLERATFRDINFGEPSEQGARSTIAGREAVRAGFKICGRCGKVQKPPQPPQHTFSCPSRKEEAEAEIEPCLFLYREFSSEALRLLLPMADVTTTGQLHSFIAALQVGLKERFGGSVDHLRTTVYSDPVSGSSLRRQYLVLYDTVPGGTGYLKQLITPAAEGGEIPLFEAMDRALERIESCSCWHDPERDGCYRCLYGYRNSRDMDDTSAQTACELLRRILAGRGKLIPSTGLSEISVSALMDSVLEVRFIEALRRISQEDRAARLQPAVVNGKPGYRWALGEVEWMVEPQVEPPAAETGGVAVSIDFVLRPAHAGTARRLAVFLDGWDFHQKRIGKDLRQRMALEASGRWDVWAFTWADLAAKLSTTEAPSVPELAVPDAASLKQVLRQMGLPQFANLGEQSVFDWFEAELRSPEGLPWAQLGRAVLAARMRVAGPRDAAAWVRFIERVAPPPARAALAALPPRLVALETENAAAHPLCELMAVHDGGGPGTGHEERLAVVTLLDDRDEQQEGPALKAAWQGTLRLFQLLRKVPRSWFMTAAEGGEHRGYAAIFNLREATSAPPVWPGLQEVQPPYLPLAERLMAAGVREPVVGLEVPDLEGSCWGEAELVWEEERVAVISRETRKTVLGRPAAGWTIFELEDLDDDPAPIVAALQRKES